MDQHGEKEEWGASEQWIPPGGREQRAEGHGVVDQRLELLGIAPHLAMGIPNPGQEREIRIRQMLEVERAQHPLYDATRSLHLAPQCAVRMTSVHIRSRFPSISMTAPPTRLASSFLWTPSTSRSSRSSHAVTWKPGRSRSGMAGTWHG